MRPEEVPQRIQDCFDAGKVEVTRHFWDELRADDFVLADVRHALEFITGVRVMGEDRDGNPKFQVRGPAVDERPLSVICAFKKTGAVLLITVYEGDEP